MAAKTSYVIVFREAAPGEWFSRQIPETRLQAHIEGGWTILIRESDVRDQAIADTHAVEQVQWEAARRERL